MTDENSASTTQLLVAWRGREVYRPSDEVEIAFLPLTAPDVVGQYVQRYK